MCPYTFILDLQQEEKSRGQTNKHACYKARNKTEQGGKTEL